MRVPAAAAYPPERCRSPTSSPSRGSRPRRSSWCSSRRISRDHDYWATGVFCVAMSTDWFDGRIARRSGRTTSFGSLLDPVADKVLVLGDARSCCSISGVFPAWMVAAIVARELLVSGLRLAALERGVVIAARDLGKLKTWSQAVAAAAGGLAAAGAWSTQRLLVAAADRARPDLGLRPGLRALGAERAPRPRASRRSRRIRSSYGSTGMRGASTARRSGRTTSDGEPREFFYSRYGHPTGAAAEARLGELEGGEALLFASGMAPRRRSLLAFARPGTTVALAEGAYFGTSVLLGALEPWGLGYRRVRPDRAAARRRPTSSGSSRRRTRRSPCPTGTRSGPTRGSIVCDATVSTPVYLRALDEGADVVIHSGDEVPDRQPRRAARRDGHPRPAERTDGSRASAHADRHRPLAALGRARC